MKYDLEAIIYEELVLELSNRGLLDEGFLDKAKKFATTAALGGALALGMGGNAQAANVNPSAKPVTDVVQSIMKDKTNVKKFRAYLANENDKALAAMKFIADYGGPAGKTAVKAAASLSEDEFLKAISMGLAGANNDSVSSDKAPAQSTRQVKDLGGGKYEVSGYSSPDLARAAILNKAGNKPIKRIQSKGNTHIFQIGK
jgi:hypothetical protein